MYESSHPVNIEMLLDGIQFPARKAEIVEYAIEQGAASEALELLRAIPDNDYRNMKDINAKLGLIEPLPMEDNQFASDEVDDEDEAYDHLSADEKAMKNAS